MEGCEAVRQIFEWTGMVMDRGFALRILLWRARRGAQFTGCHSSIVGNRLELMLVNLRIDGAC